MSEPRKSETDLRDKAIMHQQRRLKQATQFTHKDSADLLPLDGLKRLGTSKDLQPHSIVQRRLLEGNIPRLRREAPDAPAHVRSPLVDSKDVGETEEKSESTVDDSAEERESPEESERSLRSEEEEEEEEEDEEEEEEELKQKQGEQTEREGEHQRASALSALMVQCKCGDAEVKVSVNTGSQHNQISTTCCRRLGLKASLKSKALCEVSPILLQFGKQRVECAAQVVEDEASELCLGLQTLLELKCCVDLNTRVLRLHGSGEELPFLETPACSQCHRHDNNKNL